MFRKEMMKVVQLPIWQHFRALLLNEMPQGYPEHVAVTETMLVREEGRMRGWIGVLNLIDRATSPLPEIQLIENTNLDPITGRNVDYGPE